MPNQYYNTQKQMLAGYRTETKEERIAERIKQQRKQDEEDMRVLKGVITLTQTLQEMAEQRLSWKRHRVELLNAQLEALK